MKVLLSRPGGLFVCGTNAFNPLCANYTVSKEQEFTQQVEGEHTIVVSAVVHLISHIDRYMDG